jgi:chorismate synthase
VAAGVIAKKILKDVVFSTAILEIGGKKDFEKTLEEALATGDSVGGLIELRVNGIPAGLGGPFFDSLEGCIAKILFAIPGVRGIEFGDGFKAATMKGSQHNDPYIDSSSKTTKNGAGGINGGISNGNEIIVRVAIKPLSSIKADQESYSLKTKSVESISVPGRHDTCIALRCGVVLEAALALVLADFALQAGIV